MLYPGFGLTFDDLYATAGLARVDRAFLAHLAAGDASLHDRLLAARADPSALGRLGESELLLALAPHLEDFLGRLFGVQAEVSALQAAQNELAPLFACKRQFVQRKALNRYKSDVASAFDGVALRAELEPKIGAPLAGLAGELAFARSVGAWGRRRNRERGGYRSRAALCGVGGAQRRRQGSPQGRRAVQGAAQARFHAAGPGRSRNAQRCRDVSPAGETICGAATGLR